MGGGMNFLRGYVRVRLQSKEPERFLNLCAARRICIWAILRRENFYKLCLGARDFFRLKEIAFKTGSQLKILEKRGLPFFFQRNRKRKAFFLGGFLCLFLLFLLSRYIWNIHIEGNYANSTGTVLEFLDSIGVRHGMAASQADCQKIAAAIREEFSNVTWVSARIRGTRLLIEIKENVDGYPVREEEPDSALDLRAQEEGIVYSILTRSGVPLVKAGDACKPGDILVSGQIPIADDSGTVLRYEPVRADADILIQSRLYYYQEFSLKHTVRRYQENTRKAPFLEIMGWRLETGKTSDESCDYLVREHQVFLTENFALPVRYGTVEILPYEETTEIYTEQEAKALAENQLEAYMEDLKKSGVEILENHVKIEMSDTDCRAAGFLTVLSPSVEEAPSEAPETETGKEES